MNTKIFKKELAVRSIKIMDMGYLYGLYGVLGLFFAFLFDKIYGSFDPALEEKKSSPQILLEILVIFWIVGVVTYVLKNLIELIPFPLEGVYGFKHHRVKELTSASPFFVTLLWFFQYFSSKISYLRNRLFPTKNSADVSNESRNSASRNRTTIETPPRGK